MSDLRFVLCDGKRILQQSRVTYHTNSYGHVSSVGLEWHDVPLVDEETGEPIPAPQGEP